MLSFPTPDFHQGCREIYALLKSLPFREGAQGVGQSPGLIIHVRFQVRRPEITKVAACRSGYSVRYGRTSRLLHTLDHARQDGSYLSFLRSLNKTDVLILDDWMRDPIQLSAAQELLEIFDDRFNKRLL